MVGWRTKHQTTRAGERERDRERRERKERERESKSVREGEREGKTRQKEERDRESGLLLRKLREVAIIRNPYYLLYTRLVIT